VVVPNKPGKGAHLLGAFKEAGVNFVGIWGYPVGKSKARIDGCGRRGASQEGRKATQDQARKEADGIPPHR